MRGSGRIASGLACEAPADHTWAIADDPRRAISDAFFRKSESGKPNVSNAEAFQPADPTLHHAAVRVILRKEQIGDTALGGPAASSPDPVRLLAR